MLKITPKDRNKFVVMSNGSTAKIVSVIKENGHLCMIIGSRQDDRNMLIWNYDGGSEILGCDIIRIIDNG